MDPLMRDYYDAEEREKQPPSPAAPAQERCEEFAWGTCRMSNRPRERWCAYCKSQPAPSEAETPPAGEQAQRAYLRAAEMASALGSTEGGGLTDGNRP